MTLYAKRIEGQAGMYRLHTDGCQAVRYKGAPVLPRGGTLVMQGDYPLPISPRGIGKPCRRCKARIPTEVLIPRLALKDGTDAS